jgi:hypothetical protein
MKRIFLRSIAIFGFAALSAIRVLAMGTQSLPHPVLASFPQEGIQVYALEQFNVGTPFEVYKVGVQVTKGNRVLMAFEDYAKINEISLQKDGLYLQKGTFIPNRTLFNRHNLQVVDRSDRLGLEIVRDLDNNAKVSIRSLTDLRIRSASLVCRDRQGGGEGGYTEGIDARSAAFVGDTIVLNCEVGVGHPVLSQFHADANVSEFSPSIFLQFKQTPMP